MLTSRTMYVFRPRTTLSPAFLRCLRRYRLSHPDVDTLLPSYMGPWMGTGFKFIVRQSTRVYKLNPLHFLHRLPRLLRTCGIQAVYFQADALLISSTLEQAVR